MVTVQTTENTLAVVLTAAGIGQVIWIDDLFDSAVQPATAEARLADVLGQLKGHKLLPRDPLFATATLEDDVADWVDMVGGQGDPAITERVRSVVERQLVEFGHTDEPSGSVQANDYDLTQVSEILKSFGDRVRKVGLESWNREKAAIIAGLTAETLVVVDREFGAEQAATHAGDEIVQELLQGSGRAPIVMLTHSVSHEDAATDALRRSIASEIKVEWHRFAVISKRSPEDVSAGAEAALRRSLRGLMTRSACAGVANKLSEVMIKALRDTEVSLLGLSIYDLDLAVFENSLNEGASELDVLLRLLLLRQRVSVQDHVVDNRSDLGLIDRVRSLRALTALGDERVSDEQGALLRSWRRSEVFDPRSKINGSFSPLMCGDIFQKKGSTNAFVLLAQPCDIALRADGSRKVDEGLFVTVKIQKVKPKQSRIVSGVWKVTAAQSDLVFVGDDKYPEARFLEVAKERFRTSPSDAVDVEVADGVDYASVLKLVDVLRVAGFAQLDIRGKDAPDSRFYKLPSLVDGQDWRVDLRKGSAVRLSCLDLAIFNPEGDVQFSKVQREPSYLLPGWKARFAKVRESITASFSKERPQVVAISSPPATGRVPKPSNSSGAEQGDVSSPPAGLESLSLDGAVSRGGAWKGEVWGFDNFSRIGRLREQWAVAVYAAYAVYQTRAAFDHDFATGTGAQ